MAQITILLPITEKEALQLLADREYRDPRKQAGLLIREALERRGLLSPLELKAERRAIQENRILEGSQ